MAKQCPKCGSDFVQRAPRSFWMRLVPGSIAVRCGHCKLVSMVRNTDFSATGYVQVSARKRR
jgi:hypothetical protein